MHSIFCRKLEFTHKITHRARMTNRLMWLSDEAHSHGWTLLARYRDAKITYVLAVEHGEMEFDTLDEVEQEMRSVCRIRKLPPLRDA
jgi:hypothetical protein